MIKKCRSRYTTSDFPVNVTVFRVSMAPAKAESGMASRSDTPKPEVNVPIVFRSDELKLVGLLKASV